jgi:hypothetical protein
VLLGSDFVVDANGDRIIVESALGDVQLRDAMAAVGVMASSTPPENPQPGQYWLSNSLKHLRVSPLAADRAPLNLASGSDLGGQEPTAWHRDGRWHLLYTTGNTRVGYTYCDGDPMDPLAWAASVDVIGGGAGGYAGQAAHSFAFFEGDTIYYYFVCKATSGDFTAQKVYVATASLDDPTTFTTQAEPVVDTPPGNGNGTGNMCVVKDGDTYFMFIECLDGATFPTEGATNSWQTLLMSSSSPDGAFVGAGEGGAEIVLTSLRPTPNASVSGPQVLKEGDDWIMYYHGGSWGRSFPNYGYRAFATDISGNDWTVDNGKRPFIKRKHLYEVDQIADLCVAQAPSGAWYLFYAANNNRSGGWFKLMVTPLIPVLMQWDGFDWRPVGLGDGPQDYHDESAPWYVQYGPFFSTSQPAAKVGTWALDKTTSGLIGGSMLYNGSAAQNDAVEFEVVLTPGTWQLELLHQKGPGMGVIALKLNDGGGGYVVNTSPQSVDCYATEDSYNNVTTITLPILGEETQRRRLRLRTETKNASASAYGMGIQGLYLRRTDVGN